MHDESSRRRVDEAPAIESAILALLLVEDEQRPWSVDELASEVGSDLDTADAIAALHRAGLIHRCGDFVFATRAAVHSQRLCH
jgi:hypothetical protein